MLIAPKTLEKMRRLESVYRRRIYEPVQSLPCLIHESTESLRQPPGPDADWKPCPSGTAWGAEWQCVWFKTELRIPDTYRGRAVYVMAHTGAVETLFWRNGVPSGIFNYDPFIKIRGDHRAQLVDAHADPSRTYHLAFEGYAGHPSPGSQPGETLATQTMYPMPCRRTFDHITWCVRNDTVFQFVHDLAALNGLSVGLTSDSFRKGRIDAALVDVFTLVYQEPDTVDRSVWMSALDAAIDLMRPLLACRNGDSAPYAGIVGHSHMDTAWHWPIEETIRKCARTFSNALRLMEQYPEYIFIQSGALHADWMRRYYPSIFAGIQQRVAEGRWEPNGGVWIEPDVNLAGGESLIRHFHRGQTFTQTFMNYRSDTFWLPDTFGYSAALPQILAGCGIRYFLTTKLTWNETNTFPYDTFWWEGIDGTRVLSHFNDIHCAPDPETLINKLHGTGPRDFRVVQNNVRHKDVNQRRLISYGYGDGGGGPDASMIEMARRCGDLEGCPKAMHTTVSRFMRELEAEAVHVPTYVGELYLEGHRGTFTQMHEIKRRNRRAESALREAECMLVCAGLERDVAMTARLAVAWDCLLINQFHDILPGTSIACVHDRAINELGAVIDEGQAIAREAGASLMEVIPSTVTVFNSLNWNRDEARLTGLPSGTGLEGVIGQPVETPWNESSFALAGLNLPPMGGRSFSLVLSAISQANDPFVWNGHEVTSPHLAVRFAEGGGLSSVRMIDSGRELAAGNTIPLNTFLFGEDVPAAWDNWDIDADLQLKLKPELSLVDQCVAARGPLQFRLRQTYTFGRGSRLIQDVVVHARHTRIDFETLIEWRESHRFLSVVFPLAVHAPSARHEIQFGHIERPTHVNTSEDRARFEVCQHKWTDLSENRFGVALLNDGKYGVSVRRGTIKLSLHKGGCHPDARGDAGDHMVTYSLFPHNGAFAAESVVRPAYELNITPTMLDGAVSSSSLLTVDAPNIVLETVKPAADGRGYIVRLYECERQATRTTVRFARSPVDVWTTNLLEEQSQSVPIREGAVELDFRPFEIKTIRVIA